MTTTSQPNQKSSRTSSLSGNPRKRHPHKKSHSPSPEGMPSRSPRAQTTSLESIRILPRTPKTPRTSERWTPQDGEPIDEVELSLLGEDERRQAAEGAALEDEMDHLSQGSAQKHMSAKDKRAVMLLVILCECLLVDLEAMVELKTSPRLDSRIPRTLRHDAIFV